MQWLYILILGLGISIIFVLLVYLWIKFNFNPTETGKISDNIICIKNSIANVYLYMKDSDYVMIDAGIFSKSLKNELNKMGINLREISHIFITHSDLDHIGGLSIFNNVDVYIGEGSRIKDPEKFHFLKDNEEVKVGAIKVKAVDTPGHRNGHFSYLIDDKYLFTGDLLRIDKGKIKPFFKIISSNYDQLIESIKKVIAIPDLHMILTAHTGCLTDIENSIDKWTE